jgi:hypothetical protein
MPSRSGVIVQGFTEIQRSLRELEDGSDRELRRRLKDIGERVALVAASNAPRRTGELQHSIKASSTVRGASVYSNVVYGGAINYGAYPKLGPTHRGPHIKRERASQYMQKGVEESTPYVEQQVNELLDWAMAKFEEN